LAALALYFVTLAPSVLEADSGEFQFVPWLPGIAHPTGYPLYILLGWLWTHSLPVGDVAWRMNLLSAVLAAAAVGLTYAVARRMAVAALPDAPPGSQMVAAVLAAATFALGHTFWSQAIIAEVYALHALFVAAILWLALKRAHSALALAFGLGLTHHRTTILLLPALFFWFYRAGDLRKITWGKSGRYGLLVGAPLLLYLYLPLIAPTTPYATLHLSDTQILTLYDNSPAGFWAHVMATVFAGDVRPAAVGAERLTLAGGLLLPQAGWPGLLLALIGLGTLWHSYQLNLLGLTGLGALTFTLFNLVYFIGDIAVLFIPVWFFVSLWVGMGALGLAHWGATAFVRHKSRAPAGSSVSAGIGQRLHRDIYQIVATALTLLCLLGVALPLAAQNIGVGQQHNRAAAEQWRAILAQPLPPGAILLSNDRNEMMPMWYYQYVEQRRPDLLGLFPLVVPGPDYATSGRLLDQALAAGRPVYLIKPMPGLSLKADLTPAAGGLWQATANPSPPAFRQPATLTGEGSAETLQFQGYDLSAATLTPGQALTVTLHWQVVQPLHVDYTSYVHLLDGAGQRLAQNDHRPGGDFYPSSQWYPDETLRDHHRLSIPANAPAGAYHLRAGVYYQPAPGQLIGMGDSLEFGTLAITTSREP
jgi:hypothetical protein